MIFNKTNFRIYSLAEKEARYHLNGIHVTPDYTEVTNGHYLIRVDAPYKGKRKEALKDCPIVNKQAPVTRECEFVIPTEAAREIEKNIPKERGLTQLNNAWVVEDKEETATFLTTDLQTTKPVTFCKIGEKFPNTNAVIDNVSKKAPITIGFNTEYMMKICQQYKKADIKCVSLSLFGLTKAMKLEGTSLNHDQTITTILMPMKTGNDKDTWNVKEKNNEK